MVAGGVVGGGAFRAGGEALPEAHNAFPTRGAPPLGRFTPKPQSGDADSLAVAPQRAGPIPGYHRGLGD